MTAARTGRTSRRIGLVATGLGALAALAWAATPRPAPIEGGWEGQVSAGAQRAAIRVCVRSGAGSTVDLPDFGWYDVPVRVTRRDNGATLAFSVYGDGARLVLDGEAGGRARGRWEGAGAPGAVELRATPGCGPRYRTEPFDFENEGVRLAGTLLLPDRAGAGVRVPAIVWTHGSGTVGRTDPVYRGLAVALTEAGIASLIYDKRGVGQSGGNWRNADMPALARDAIAAVERLRGHAALEPRLIGVGGISQGGWIAPDAAAHSAAVGFVVALSAPGITPADQNLFNQYNKVLNAGFSAAIAARADSILRDIYRYYLSGEGRERLERTLSDISGEPWFEAAYELAIWLRRGMMQGPVTQAYRQALYYDPTTIWPRVRVPTVALWGEADDLVPAERSERVIAAALDRAGNRNRRLVVLPEADHTLRVPAKPPWTWGLMAPGFAEAGAFVRRLETR